MKRKGRDFEVLVKRIEEFAELEGAIVKSPDFITCKITGVKREVDVSIVLPVERGSGLITIECRDRNSIQDVTWIEQLVAKRSNLGALATIAVSSEGFSKTAVAMGAHHGVLLRSLKSVTDEELQSWVGRYMIRKLRLKIWSVSEVVLFDIYRQPLDASSLPVCIADNFNKQALSEPVLKGKYSGRIESYTSLVKSVLCRHYSDWYSACALPLYPKSPASEVMATELVDDCYTIVGDESDLQVRAVRLRFDVSAIKGDGTVVKVINYTDDIQSGGCQELVVAEVKYDTGDIFTEVMPSGPMQFLSSQQKRATKSGLEGEKRGKGVRPL